MFAFERAGADKKTINDVGFERFRPGASGGGLHPANRKTVGKHFDGDGVGIGDQVPERLGKAIGLPFGKLDDFDFSQTALMVQTEEYDVGVLVALGHARANLGARPRSGDMGDVKDPRFEPIGEKYDVNANQQNGEQREEQLFFCHKRCILQVRRKIGRIGCARKMLYSRLALK